MGCKWAFVARNPWPPNWFLLVAVIIAIQQLQRPHLTTGCGPELFGNHPPHRAQPQILLPRRSLAGQPATLVIARSPCPQEFNGDMHRFRRHPSHRPHTGQSTLATPGQVAHIIIYRDGHEQPLRQTESSLLLLFACFAIPYPIPAHLPASAPHQCGKAPRRFKRINKSMPTVAKKTPGQILKPEGNKSRPIMIRAHFSGTLRSPIYFRNSIRASHTALCLTSLR